MYKKVKNNKAFTLIELIVVVGIIGILVGIASPRFAGFTKNARVSGLKTDTELLSKAAEFHKFKTGEWPVSDEEVGNIDDLISNINDEDKASNFKKIDKDKIEDGIGRTSNKISEYVLATEGKYKGLAFHVEGKLDKNDERHHWHGNNIQDEGMSKVSKEYIDSMVKLGYIPISNGDELNKLRESKIQRFGLGTMWEGDYLSGLDEKYIQIKDINLDKFNNFEPINNFHGTYDGNNYVIRNLKINLPEKTNVGLFTSPSGALIKNTGLENVSVKGKTWVGGLIGMSEFSTKIINSYVTGEVVGDSYVGGLVGYSDRTSIKNSYSVGIVHGNGWVSYSGGLVGYNDRSSIENSYTESKVFGDMGVGGLVGNNDRSSIKNSFVNSEVLGNSWVGGIAGVNNSSINDSGWNKDKYTNAVGSESGDVTNTKGFTTSEIEEIIKSLIK